MSEQPAVKPLLSFENRAIEDREETAKNGRICYKNVPFVMVTTQGGKNVFEDEAENWLKRQRDNLKKGKIPIDHLEYFEKSFERFLKGQEIALDGTDLKMWTLIDPARLRVCQSAGIYTVEGLAAANDEALRRLGMGAFDLKQMAVDWLKSADSGKISTELAGLREKLDAALDIIEQQKEELDKIRSEAKSKKG
jgi:hypothetical protein